MTSSVADWAQRVRRAVAASGRSEVELVDELGFGTVEKHENWLSQAMAGQREPSIGELATLSALIDVPLSVLTGSVRFERSFAVALRSGVVDGAQSIDAAAQRAREVLDDLKLLASWFPEEQEKLDVALTAARRCCSGNRSARRAGEMSAQRLRSILEFGDSPVSDLVALVEGLGAIVLVERLPDGVHGITVCDVTPERSYYVVLVNAADSWGRQRYTLAHELCHLLFDDAVAMVVDRKEPIDEKNPSETRADAFARHFLVQDSAVRKFLRERPNHSGAQKLTDFILLFGMSREASVNTLCNVMPALEKELDQLRKEQVGSLMHRTGNGEIWEPIEAARYQSSLSPRLTSMALRAYCDDLVTADLVARAWGRDDVDNFLQELEGGGWSLENRDGGARP